VTSIIHNPGHWAIFSAAVAVDKQHAPQIMINAFNFIVKPFETVDIKDFITYLVK
jgi:hypothetical protein